MHDVAALNPSELYLFGSCGIGCPAPGQHEWKKLIVVTGLKVSTK